MNNEQIKTDASEMGPDDDNVSRLLSTLKRVEAPNDFDFRVKARIAAGRPATRRPFGLPAAVGYAIPLVLVVLIGAYFGINALNANKTVNTPTVAEAPKVNPAPPVAQPSNVETVTPQNSTVGERAGVIKQDIPGGDPAANPTKKMINAALPSNRRGGGSMVEMSDPGRQLLPKGLNPNQLPPSKSSGLDRTTPVPAQNFLNDFGMKGSFGDSGWKVGTVTPDSPAAHWGVKAGDVIEAIDDKALTEKTSVKGGSFRAKSLRVRRGDASIQIVLKP